MIHPNRLATLSVVKAKKLEFHYRWRSSICVHHRPWHRRSHPEAVEWQFSPTARSIQLSFLWAATLMPWTVMDSDGRPPTMVRFEIISLSLLLSLKSQIARGSTSHMNICYTEFSVSTSYELLLLPSNQYINADFYQQQNSFNGRRSCLLVYSELLHRLHARIMS